MSGDAGPGGLQKAVVVVGLVAYLATGFVYLTSGLVVPMPWLAVLWVVWLVGLWLVARLFQAWSWWVLALRRWRRRSVPVLDRRRAAARLDRLTQTTTTPDDRASSRRVAVAGERSTAAVASTGRERVSRPAGVECRGLHAVVEGQAHDHDPLRPHLLSVESSSVGFLAGLGSHGEARIAVLAM